MKYNIWTLSLILLIGMTFTACQKAPSQDVVTSKNDGSFDINILQSATSPQEENIVQIWSYDDQFTSTDGTVNFTLNISEEIPQKEMPVVQISPHFLTAEDARRVADVLFPDTTFYDSVLALNSDALSKSDLQEKISRWSPYTSTDMLSTLFPYGSAYYQQKEQIINMLKDSIEYYTELYEIANDGNPHTVCEWVFRPESQYLYTEAELQGMDLSKDNEAIEVMLKYHNIPYYIAFTKRNQQDFKLSSIFAYPSTGYSPRSIDEYILRAKLTRTEKPTDAQIAALSEKAQNLLDRMELGVWEIDNCSLETTVIGEFTEYIINISAVPVIEGVSVGRREQSMNLHSESAFASNYYISDVQFRFSPDGELLYFEMQSPFDVSYIVNDNVATMSFDALMEKAKMYFVHSDGNQYDLNIVTGSVSEKVLCNVTISEMEYALSRVKVPNTDESYYYIPCVFLRGDIEIVGAETGTAYFSKTNQELLTLNAVDGTIINSTNE